MLAVMPTRVQYQGSIEDKHGEYRVVGECECDRCDEAFTHAWRYGMKPPEGRLELTDGVNTLRCVRLSSVTPLD